MVKAKADRKRAYWICWRSTRLGLGGVPLGASEAGQQPALVTDAQRAVGELVNVNGKPIKCMRSRVVGRRSLGIPEGLKPQRRYVKFKGRPPHSNRTAVSNLDSSVLPELFEAPGRQLGIADRVLDVLVSKVELDSPCVLAGVGQVNRMLEPYSHVRTPANGDQIRTLGVETAAGRAQNWVQSTDRQPLQ
jgi:hypothetical protein